MKFVDEHPEVTQSSSLLRKNRSCSYISFMIKEIYDYYTMILDDGFPVYKLRNEYNEFQIIKNELIKINPEIKNV